MDNFVETDYFTIFKNSLYAQLELDLEMPKCNDCKDGQLDNLDNQDDKTISFK